MSLNSHKINILLADDDTEDRELFAEALEESGLDYNLKTFENGKQLVDYLNLPNQEVPNLLFLDLNMPLLSGLESLKIIRANTALDSMPVAIYSTSSSENDKNNTFQNGANLYISKPSDFSQLKKMLRQVVLMREDLSSTEIDKDKFVFTLGVIGTLIYLSSMAGKFFQ
jgi:CheY-like chemotaxis protein